MKTIKLKPIMTVEQADSMAGVLLKESDCKLLVTYDADIYDQETGKCIAKFRKNIIPADVQMKAFEALLPAAVTSTNRGTSAGQRDKDSGRVSKQNVRSDGMRSKTVEAPPVNSGIVGYFDRSARTPYCRLTAFTAKKFKQFKEAYPIIKFVDIMYSKLMPTEYKRQRKIADQTSQDFVIKGTAFTTVTVNKNWQTAVHQDAGDFKEGFGNLVALRQGTYTGGNFVVVRWGVGFDLQNGDLLLVDVHQWHGNTPILKASPKAVRLSLVMYYRENMKHCGSIEQELKRASTRQRGSKLN